jgi:hypothetical protein
MGSATQSRSVVVSSRQPGRDDAVVDHFVIVRPHRSSLLADALEMAEIVESDDALSGHRTAWEEVDDVSLIADASCFPMLGSLHELGLDDLLAESGEDVLVLGGNDESWCYLVTPAGAARLAGADGTLAERLDGSLSVDPPLVIAAHDPVEIEAEPVGTTASQLDVLLGYVGAVDPAPGWYHLHDDIVVVPCWTRRFCEVLIDAAESVDAWSSDPDDPVPGNEVSLAMISPRVAASLHAHWAGRIWPVIRQVWPLADFAGFRDAFVIRFSPNTVPDLRTHHDVAQVSAAIKLNDGYDGGALSFPRQGVHTANVPVGAAVIWPSLVTHPHRSEPVRRGTKYSVTVWSEIPGITGRAAPR